MLEAIAFDSLSFVKRLTASGFTEAQAEGLAHEQVNLLHSNLATKADLEALRLANQVEIEKLREATKADFEKLRVEIEKLRETTKADLEALRLANQAEIEKLRETTKADLEKFRETTRADLASAKVEIVKWMVGALAAQGALIVTLIKLT